MDRKSLHRSFGLIRKKPNHLIWVTIIIILLVVGLLFKNSNIILAITALIIFFYTYETYKMRKEIVDQRKLESTPFVYMLIEKDPYKFLIKNVGEATAVKVDVKILKPRKKDVSSIIEEVLVSFKTVEILVKGEERELKIGSMNDPEVSSFPIGSMLDSAYIRDLIKRSQLYGLHFKLKFRNILSESYHGEVFFEEDEFYIKDFGKD